MTMPSPSVLNEAFRYDGASLFWKSHRRTPLIGREIKTMHKSGYLVVTLQQRQMLVHRVIWAMAFGEWPQSPLDHVNGITTDNRLENLRPCTSSQNSANRRSRRLGLKGVTLHKPTGKYQVQLAGVYLGLYPTPEAAANAYDIAAAARYGEFAFLNREAS